MRKFKRFEDLMLTLTKMLQFLLALVIVAGIVIQLLALPNALKELYANGQEDFREFLKYIIDMVIGLELIHLLSRPTLDSVVEILLFALTREIVLGEMNPTGIFLSIVCIAILFAVRKFLFIKDLNDLGDKVELPEKKVKEEEKQKES